MWFIYVYFNNMKRKSILLAKHELSSIRNSNDNISTFDAMISMYKDDKYNTDTIAACIDNWDSVDLYDSYGVTEEFIKLFFKYIHVPSLLASKIALTLSSQFYDSFFPGVDWIKLLQCTMSNTSYNALREFKKLIIDESHMGSMVLSKFIKQNIKRKEAKYINWNEVSLLIKSLYKKKEISRERFYTLIRLLHSHLDLEILIYKNDMIEISALEKCHIPCLDPLLLVKCNNIPIAWYEKEAWKSPCNLIALLNYEIMNRTANMKRDHGIYNIGPFVLSNDFIKSKKFIIYELVNMMMNGNDKYNHQYQNTMLFLTQLP